MLVSDGMELLGEGETHNIFNNAVSAETLATWTERDRDWTK